MKLNSWLIATLVIIIASCTSDKTQKESTKDEFDHFDSKGNPPSEYTVKNWEELKNTLPFEDKRDFEEQKRGFIAAPEYKEIIAEAGHVAWSMGKYDFLLEGKEFQSIHPSLQR